MTRTMHDAVTPSNIDPAAVQLVAGYLNGRYAWSAADWARFPNAVRVDISVRAYWTVGHVLDVETGDATPEEAPGWVAMRRRSGLATPTIYCNRSTWPMVRAAFDRANVPYPLFWIATASGKPEIPDGAIAAQYLLDVAPGIDVSAVRDYWPGVDPAPSNGGGAALSTTGVEIMQTITVTPPNAGQNTVRVFLSGSPGAAVVIRPRLGGDGFSKPMWVGDIFAWSSDHQGIGHNPTQVAGYDNKLTSHRRYELPGALWADINYSAAEAFQIDIVG